MRKEPAWKSKRDVGAWRKFLTAQESAFIARSDAAVAELRKLEAKYRQQYSAKRAVIVNRAIHRAKYAAIKSKAPAL